MQKHLLRTVFLFVICNLSFVTGKAQWVTIPDANFRAWLNAHGYSACMNGSQMNTTCSAVINATGILCRSAGIHDLTGIEYFIHLTNLDCSYNSLTTLPNLPSNLVYLTCSSNQIATLPTLPTSLTSLTCSNGQLSTLPTLPTSLTYLYCSGCQLTTLPPLPAGLSELYCDNNLLTNLPVLPAFLTVLECYGNLLTNLPALPTSLTSLKCPLNQITSLPALPVSLIVLECYRNLLTNLPALPASLTFLNCRDNQLTILPTLPASLTVLDCHNNQLTTLPALPASLTGLSCNNNQLTNLPSLPDSLSDIICYSNQLTSLPTLPAALNYIECNANQLTNLPALPNTLNYLNCMQNQLSTLPTLPASLKRLWCSYNQLSSIPELPDSLYNLDCSNNPNLYCLPELKKIKQFYFNGTGITCLPNFPQSNTSSGPSLSSVPLCGLFNNNGCSVYWNITGKVYNDANNNCTDDVNESAFGNFPVKLSSSAVLQQQVYTGTEGFYSFNANYGTYDYTVDTTGLPVLVTCPSSGTRTSNITALDSMDFSMDFGMRCKTGFDVGVWSCLSGSHFRPGNNATMHIGAGDYARFFGIGCASVSGQVVVSFSGPVTYVSNAGALAPSSVSGNTITYTIADFSLVNVFNSFGFVLNINTNAQSGQQVCINISVTPTAGDGNPANNSLSHCFTVVNSYDPNKKEVSPIGDITADAQWLTYTIHFQNTGTAEAQHIYVDDTLDAALDASTFQLLAYSHQPLTQVFDLERRVRFNFPNINLPDSTHNEPQSHGYVQYRIKTKPAQNCGTVIGNPAYIYFDFNSPVVTNAALNTIRFSTTTNLQANICNGEQYDFQGTALNSAGDYADTLQTGSACDSIVNLHLAVLPTSSSNINTSVCDGETFYVGNHAHNQAGTFNDTLQTANGCDSVVQLSLSIANVYQFAIDTSITQGNSYTLPSGNIVTATGVYTDTLHTISGCDSVITTHLDVLSGIPSNPIKGESLRISPNPASSSVTVSIDETLLTSTLNVYDVTGKRVAVVQLSFINNQLSIENLASGVYMAEIKTTQTSVRRRWVKM